MTATFRFRGMRPNTLHPPAGAVRVGKSTFSAPAAAERERWADSEMAKNYVSIRGPCRRRAPQKARTITSCSSKV